MTIRELIIQRRTELGVTQNQLSTFTGIAQNRISEFESGNRDMNAKSIDKIFDALDVKLSLIANSAFDYPKWIETQEDYPEGAEVDYFDDSYPNMVILENEKYWSVNLGTGLGAGVYAKESWRLDKAIEDQNNVLQE